MLPPLEAGMETHPAPRSLRAGKPLHQLPWQEGQREQSMEVRNHVCVQETHSVWQGRGVAWRRRGHEEGLGHEWRRVARDGMGASLFQTQGLGEAGRSRGEKERSHPSELQLAPKQAPGWGEHITSA